MQKTLIIFILSLLTCAVMAQGTFQPKKIDNTPLGIVYDKEMSFNIRLHTNGLAMGINIGTIQTFYKTRFYQFEIGGVRHPKEYRQNFDYQSGINGRSSRSFVFGKRNSLINLRAGVGAKRYLTEKAKKRGLSAGYSYVVGGTLGILKPYYLELYQSVDGQNFLTTEKYSTENEDRFLDIRNIFGAAKFSKGFDELSFQPGFHAKAAVHLDWGAFDEMVKAVEVGFMIDVYLKKVPVMIESDMNQNTENQPFFLNLYLNFEIGKRW